MKTDNALTGNQTLMKEMTLKEIQNESFKVLLKIKEICEKENLQFFLFFGTLLGAVRHNGFIPWDDDIDVWMPRDDYEKFIEYCIVHAEEIKPFELKHYKTCKEYIYPIARLSDSRYTVKYTDTKEYGLGLFVDIYPVDGYNPVDTAHIRKIKRNTSLIGIMSADKFIPSTVNPLKNIPKYPVYLFSKFRNLNKLLEKQDKLCRKYSMNDCGMVACTIWEAEKPFNKEEIESTVNFSFEGVEMPVPIGYDSILTKLYGDYMKLPPESERNGHHFYSAFRKSAVQGDDL